MRPLRSLLLCAALAACASNETVVGSGVDAASDAPSAVDALDVRVAADVPDALDVIAAPDAPDVVATDAVDAGDGTDVADATDATDATDVTDVPVGCRRDEDCLGDPAGPACDLGTNRCVPCVTDTHCAAGSLCVGNRCVPGCTATRGCAVGLTCCAGACVDVQSTAANCGGCGMRCDLPNAMPACMNGRCAIAMCAAPFADCDGDASNGCEVDTRTSTPHCGACGRACAPPDATGACVAGACTVGACNADRADCNRNAADGCEVDTRTSVANCGSCGSACPAGPNAIPACVGGTCRTSCAAGFADCDGDATNGCEVDTRSSVANCGGCGMACGAAGGAVACAAGVCTVTRCDAGRADCNGNGRDGCETVTSADPANCGACGTACPSVDGRRVCTAGSCAPASCRAVLAANPGAPDGRYQLDLDGAADGPARAYLCDMSDGGWTVVGWQIPTELLADTTATVGEAVIGQTNRSWRLGNPEITRIRPTRAWRLNDEVTNVFVAPACVVDWTQDYIRVTTQHPCTTGYTTPDLTTVTNGRWTFCSARGIGINNEGRSCSIRMNESGFGLGVGAQTNGRAYTCDYNTARRVSLAFQ